MLAIANEQLNYVTERSFRSANDHSSIVTTLIPQITNNNRHCTSHLSVSPHEALQESVDHLFYPITYR